MLMFGREPTLILGLIRAVVVCAVAFGFELSAEQTAAVYLVAEAVLSLVNRQQVSPVTGSGISTDDGHYGDPDIV